MVDIETAGTIVAVVCGVGFTLVFGGFALDFVELNRLWTRQPTRRAHDLSSPRRLFAQRLVLAGLRWITVGLAAGAFWLLWSIALKVGIVTN